MGLVVTYPGSSTEAIVGPSKSWDIAGQIPFIDETFFQEGNRWLASQIGLGSGGLEQGSFDRGRDLVSELRLSHASPRETDLQGTRKPLHPHPHPHQHIQSLCLQEGSGFLISCHWSWTNQEGYDSILFLFWTTTGRRMLLPELDITTVETFEDYFTLKTPRGPGSGGTHL